MHERKKLGYPQWKWICRGISLSPLFCFSPITTSAAYPSPSGWSSWWSL